MTFQLLHRQGGVCPICEYKIDQAVRGRASDYVVDHCHETGEIRGVLHRSCNAAEGKVANAAGRWGAKSTKYSDIIPYLERMVTYLKKAQFHSTGMMYPDHKTPEQKAEKVKLDRRKAYAKTKAAAQVKSNQLKRSTSNE